MTCRMCKTSHTAGRKSIELPLKFRLYANSSRRRARSAAKQPAARYSACVPGITPLELLRRKDLELQYCIQGDPAAVLQHQTAGIGIDLPEPSLCHLVPSALLLAVGPKPGDGNLRMLRQALDQQALLSDPAGLWRPRSARSAGRFRRAVSDMAAPCPVSAAKGEDCAARSAVDIRGCPDEVWCGRWIISSYFPFTADVLRSAGSAPWRWRPPPDSWPSAWHSSHISS